MAENSGVFSGLADYYTKLRYGGKKGYNQDGTTDWSYRGKDGPTFSNDVTNGWTTEQWKAFGENGGGIDSAGQAVSGATWDKSGMVSGTGAKLGTSSMENSGSSWFGKDGYLGMGAQLVSAGSSVMNAITGARALKLSEKEFEHEKGLAAANLYNSGTLANTALEKSTLVGSALAGDSLTADQKQAALDKTRSGFVKTAIG